MANEEIETNQNITPPEVQDQTVPEKPRRGRPRKTAPPAETESAGQEKPQQPVKRKAAAADDLSDMPIPDDVRPDKLVVSVEESVPDTAPVHRTQQIPDKLPELSASLNSEERAEILEQREQQIMLKEAQEQQEIMRYEAEKLQQQQQDTVYHSEDDEDTPAEAPAAPAAPMQQRQAPPQIDDSAAMLFREYGTTVDAVAVARVYEKNLSIGHYFLPGAEEAVDRLSKKYRLFLVSNGTASVQKGRMTSANLYRFFEKVFVSQEIGYNKPAKEYFDGCFAQIPDFDPRKAMIVGDSLTSDILGGINAGIATCWVNPKGLPGRADIPADYEIKALSELEALLGQM